MDHNIRTVIRTESATLQGLSKIGKKLLTIGLLTTFLGMLLALIPAATSIALELIVAFCFTVFGISQLVSVIDRSSRSEQAGTLFLGILYTVAGCVFFYTPVGGLLALTAMLGVLFLFEGVLGLAFASNFKGAKGWAIVSSITATLLGVLLLVGLPQTAQWAVGLMLALNLITTGIVFSFLGREMKNQAHDVFEEHTETSHEKNTKEAVNSGYE